MNFSEMVAKLRESISYDSDGYSELVDLAECIDLLTSNNVFYASFDVVKLEAFKGMLEALRGEIVVSEEYQKAKDRRAKREATLSYAFGEIKRKAKKVIQAQKEQDKATVACRKKHGLMDDEKFKEAFLAWENKKK